MPNQEQEQEQEQDPPSLSPHRGTSNHFEQAREILEFLNRKASRSFRPVTTNLRLIVACLSTGATVENCKGVIARKVREWGGDAKMAKFLRPETLFAPKHFESYLGEREPEETVRE